MSYAMLELSLRHVSGYDYAAELRFQRSQGTVEAQIVAGPGELVQISPEALLEYSLDPLAYGTKLSTMLFAAEQVCAGFSQARAEAEAADLPLRLRLRLPATDEQLHILAWETLQDPERGGFLCASERVLLSRVLATTDPAPFIPRPRSGLEALVVVADPVDLPDYNMAPVDVAGEVERVLGSLSGVRASIVARGHGQSATLTNILDELREGPDILYLVCHGSRGDGTSYLWLEQEDGTSDQVEAGSFARRIAALIKRPPLIVLASCQSAGRPHNVGALAALGPQLAAAGAGAVLAMQGDIAMDTVAAFMPVFFHELRRDGQIDRAVAAARASVVDHNDWWMVVLFLRIRDGQLWAVTQAETGGTAFDPLQERNRSQMLRRVRTFWIDGVLENALRGTTLLRVGMHAKTQVSTWQMGVQRHDQPLQSLPAGTRPVEVLDEQGGELLILGGPGAGKTILLLDLARTLIERAEFDEHLPIPVIFNLSTWADQRLPIERWLVDELSARYDVPRRLGALWVESDAILPLLDGLDEVVPEQRDACVAAINQFDRDHGLSSLVVCCRLAEYASLRQPLQLEVKLVLQPLTQTQIAAYLMSAGEQGMGARCAIEEDALLLELAASPLMLALVLLVSRKLSAALLGPEVSLEQRRRQLFDAYIAEMLRRHLHPRYPADQVRLWLRWLARSLIQHNETIFSLERLQPTWLASAAQRRLYASGVGLVVGLLFAVAVGGGLAINYAVVVPEESVAYGMGGGVCCGLIFGWLTRQALLRSVEGRPALTVPATLGSGAALGLFAGGCMGSVLGSVGLPDIDLALGLMTGLSAGLMLGLIGAVFIVVGNPGQIVTVERLRWSWLAARASLARKGAVAAGVSLAAGVTAGLITTFDAGPRIGAANGIALGLIILISAVLGIGLIGGLAPGEIGSSATPNQGVRRSALHAMRLGGLAGLTVAALTVLIYWLVRFPFDLPYGLSLPLASGASTGPFIGLIVGMIFGGLAAVQHVVLRAVLWSSGATPHDYVGFLSYATRSVLLHQVGSGYIFIHRLLMEHFAQAD